MKIFAYILSFVVLALTASPCIDKPLDNTLQKSELTQSANNDNHQNEKDLCSPFCTCQCCQTTFFVSNIISASPTTEMLFSYSEYTSIFKSLDLFDFYIPPKA